MGNVFDKDALALQEGQYSATIDISFFVNWKSMLRLKSLRPLVI